MISYPTVLLRLCLALLFGAFIGAERQSHAQPAGLRTNALVCLGTCLFMIVSAYGFEIFINVPHVQINPAQVASYVVAGIGFLGAGTIFRSQGGDRIRGLTTAAAIWVVAAIGLACGLGMYIAAVAVTVLTLSVLIVLRLVEWFFWYRKLTSLQHLRLEATTVSGSLIGDIYEACRRAGITIEKLGVQAEKAGAMIEIVCFVQDVTAVGRAVGELQVLAGIQSVQTDLHTTTSHTKIMADRMDEEAIQ